MLQCHHHQIMPGGLLPEVVLPVVHVCEQLRGAPKINHDKITEIILTNQSWKLLTMLTYLFSTLRNKLKVPAARTLFNTQNLRRKSRNNLLIKSGVVIKGESAVTPPFFYEHGRITIGNSVFINAGCVFLDNEQISIGNDTLIGPHVTLATAGHEVSPELRGNGVTQAPINIGHNVWLGAGVVVLPGVNIGNNSVIAANSVVCSDVPENVLYAGTPAVFKRNI
ncbi:acetyltransferase [Salmonella enterica]|uniref:DapH/DapD/GlmU-related protein n=2 Tax=Enterobacteriaceae TaxID=543 RepID=UPI001DE03BC8|nr:acetyltransferase [Salmonella enterica subsp. enterica serovar Infantis]EHQ2650256.1 acetyltransferase [Salmonella enterica]EHS5250985.1 acetyltransferase [Salmonella enterica subsp. enterica serovar Typhimurium]HBC0301807.1 acetyltransferase [Salmonella enterica subsp. enterica serovar Napoli]HBZ8587111.1 acetyltransferase [Salmonella enterica subsp. enterica]HCM2972930.1 acetyltransferase [Salmonella enterica subsp. enterica serovar Coeln]